MPVRSFAFTGITGPSVERVPLMSEPVHLPLSARMTEAELLQALSSLSGSDVDLDAGLLRRFELRIVQILLVAAREWQRRDQRLRLVNLGEAQAQQLELMGITPELQTIGAAA